MYTNRLLVVIWLPCLFTALMAQSTFPWGNPIVGGWDGNRLIWADLRDDNKISVETPGQVPLSVELLPSTHSFALQGENCYACIAAKHREGDSSGLVQSASLWRWDSQNRWHRLGGIPGSLGARRVYPLSSDSFLVDLKGVMESGGRVGNLAVASFGPDGNLAIRSIVTLPFPEPMYVEKNRMQVQPHRESDAKTNVSNQSAEKAGPTAEAKFVANRKYTKIILHQMFAYNQFIPLVEGGGLLLFHWPGYLFLINEKGEVRKLVRIYDEFDEKNIQTLVDYEPVLLGAALGADGLILLAVRERDGVFLSHKFPVASKLVGPSGQPVPSPENVVHSTRLFPGIDWYELNTKTGLLTRLDNPPLGAPSRLVGGKGENLFADAFPFLVEESGRVRMMVR